MLARPLRAVASALFVFAAASPAMAQYPERNITLIVPYGAGGGTDITARMMMVGAAGEFRQELIVVNRTAGSGAQALQYLASKPADGHTLILVTQAHLLTQLRTPNIPPCADLIPVARATTAALIGDNETRRWSRHKHEFGKGSIQGVAGPEAANNAAVGGSMVPTLALGIPGSATTAIILAALIVQGVRPGPHLFTEQPTLLYAVFVSMLAANVFYLVMGLGMAKLFARISLIPPAILWPSVFILSIIGAYGPNQSLGDVFIMLVAGVVGFLFRRTGFSPAPLIMGLVLGAMVEETLKQSLIIFGDDLGGFLGRPIALVIFAVTLAGLLWPVLVRLARLRRGTIQA